jgi:hypothetical protein
MAKEPEPHKLQPDPPEGDRETIERELARQGGDRNRDGQGRDAPPPGKQRSDDKE